MMSSKAVCPKNSDHQRFITVAHVSQDWIVDPKGHFLQCLDGAVETVASPDTGNTWTCFECGQRAVFVADTKGVT